MRRSWLKHGLIGAAVGLAVVALAGAFYGGIAGIQLSIDDGRPYHRPSGLDGAALGVILFVVCGGLPAVLLGSITGVAVGRYRTRVGHGHSKRGMADRLAGGSGQTVSL